MIQDDIPHDVKRFITEHVRSVIELELLLLLHADIQKEWSATEIATQLRVDASWVERQLADLAKRGLLTRSEQDPKRYRFGPNSSEIDGVVTKLSRIYPDRRVSIIGLIYGAPSTPVQSFADAFRLRKDTNDG